jgi:uncharacterized protein
MLHSIWRTGFIVNAIFCYMEHTTRLGERIRVRRKEVGMTAARLAAAAGVTENAIRKLEAGDSAEPRFSTGIRIAEALELSSDELAGRTTSARGTPDLAKVIAAIRTIRDSLEREGVEHLDIFGSVARGDAGPESDVDVIVTPRADARFSLFNLSAVGSSLEDALARKVDIVTPFAVKNSKRLQGALEYAIRAF